jgi:DNA modification methylase
MSAKPVAVQAQNHLYYGDNLNVLRESIADESVDLIYLDPPFNSARDYNILFASPKGVSSEAQITAFEDSWQWGEQAEHEFGELMRGSNTNVAEMMQALRKFLGENDMMAYLTMMANRLIELHRCLKPTGCLYLHCDPAASHYLKIVLDGVFGKENFRSEIIWRRSGSHNSATKQFGPVHDSILVFAKTEVHRLNPLTVPHSKAYIEGEFTYTDEKGMYRLNEIMGPGARTGDSGKPWRGYDPTPKGRHWAIPESLRSLLPKRGDGLSLQQQLDALDNLGELYISPSGRPKYKQRPTGGVALQDIWAFQPGTEGALYQSDMAIDADVKWLSNEAEKLGYPTQKPVGLLERVIGASSKQGDVVLDPFCGCGTAVHAAEKLGRHWIGIDITHLAISLIEKRLKDAFPAIRFDVHGTPKDFEGARDLALRDKYQFQWWACSLVNAQPYQGQKKGADGGIDGLIFFQDEAKGHKKIVVSVKGGDNVNVAMVRDLAHVVAREKADIGLFVTLAEPTKPMTTEAVKEGYYTSPATGQSFPKVQILTIEGLLHGTQRALYPDLSQGATTFKKAKVEEKISVQPKLL